MPREVHPSRRVDGPFPDEHWIKEKVDQAARQIEQHRQRYGQTLPADLLAWARRFLPGHFRLPPSQMHRWLAEQLAAMRASRGAKINVVGPRGSAKSTVATLAAVLHEAITEQEPYIWIVSDTKHQAAAHLENVKAELIENRELAISYPQAAGLGSLWRSGAIVLRNGVMIEAFGTGQRIRGRRRRQHRPTLIICDDLENDGHIQSSLARERSRTWFHGLLMKAGTKRTNIVNLGTALHRECLAMQLHRTPGWISRIFRAIENWPDQMPLWQTWEELYQTSGEKVEESKSQNDSSTLCARDFYNQNRPAMDAGAVLLWPEQEDLYTLMCMRAESGTTAFEREKQSSPVNPDLCEWPESYFGDWIWFDQWPADSTLSGRTNGPQGIMLKAIALDPSKGADARRGDYSAFVMLGVANDGQLYIEADLARRPTPQIVADGIAWCRHFRPQVFGLETNQFQELLGADFARGLIAEGLVGITPCSIDNHINKAVRIRRLGPLLAARRLRFKTNSPGTRMLVEQLKEFPLASHDDGPDAAEMALRLAEARLQGPPPTDGLGNRLIATI